MQGQNLVAIYASNAAAEAARRQLIDAGIPAADIRLSSDRSTAGQEHDTGERDHTSFLDWLFGTAPQEHLAWYEGHLGDARTALSVNVPAGTSSERVMEILEAHEPMDLEAESVAASGGMAEPAPGAVQTSDRAAASDERDKVVPLAKEELEVGKRETERRYRVRTYVVETPVEQQVELRDERVTIERRPIGGEAVAGDGLQEREIEIVERHEEPVVAKTARPTEEVVVHKEAAERVETVRDTLRETKADVESDARDDKVAGIDRAAAGSKPGAEEPGAKK